MIVFAVLRGIGHGVCARRTDRAGRLTRLKHGFQAVTRGVLHAGAGGVRVVILAVLRGIHLYAAGRRGRAAAGARTPACAALALAQDQRLSQRYPEGVLHFGAIGLIVIILAALRAVHLIAQRLAAGRARGLARQHRLEQAAGRRVLHTGAGGFDMEVFAVRRGVYRHAALIRGGGGRKFQSLGIERIYLLRNADGAGGLALRLRRFLGNRRSVRHAGTGGIHMVIFAIRRGVVGLLIRIADRACVFAALNGDCLGHGGERRALLDIGTCAIIMIVDAGSRGVDHVRRSAGTAGGVGGRDGRRRHSHIQAQRIAGSLGRGLRTVRAQITAGQAAVIAAERAVQTAERIDGLVRRGGRPSRRRGRGHGNRRIRGRIAGAGEDRREQQDQQHDEPYAGHGRYAHANGTLEAPPAPEQIDAQRRQHEQQQIGHPVVLIHKAHQRAFIRIAAVIIVLGVLVLIAVVIAGVVIVVAIIPAVIVIAVAAIVVIITVVIIALIVGAAEATGITGVILVAVIAVVGIIRFIIICVVIIVAVVIIAAALFAKGQLQLMDPAIPKAEGKSILRAIDLQFPQFMRRHKYPPLSPAIIQPPPPWRAKAMYT